MRGFTIMCITSFIGCVVFSADKNMDVSSFLPLFEKNTIGRKVLDVRYYWVINEIKQRDIHLVFDGSNGYYQEETHDYMASLDDKCDYWMDMKIWNGKEYWSWVRPVPKNTENHVLRQNRYEHPGQVLIKSLSYTPIPDFMSFYYDSSLRSFTRLVHEENPKLKSIFGDLIVIEIQKNRFEFSKRTCTLQKIDYYSTKRSLDNRETPWKTYELYNHVDCSGVWVPCRIVAIERNMGGKERHRSEMIVIPESLRLTDTVDSAIFSITLPTGCAVQDEIRKTTYTVTTLDTDPPQDIKALEQMLEQMLEQAEEQKAAVEQEMKQKK